MNRFDVKRLKYLQIEDVACSPLHIRVLILTGIFLITQVSILPLITLPQLTELDNLSSQKMSADSDIAIRNAQVNALPILIKTVENQNHELLSMLEALPKDSELPHLLTFIGQIANENGIQIIQMDWGKKSDKQYWQQRPINIELTGHYHDLVGFFQILTQAPKLVVIDELTLNHSAFGNGALKASITANTYLYRELESINE